MLRRRLNAVPLTPSTTQKSLEAVASDLPRPDPLKNRLPTFPPEEGARRLSPAHAIEHAKMISRHRVQFADTEAECLKGAVLSGSEVVTRFIIV